MNVKIRKKIRIAIYSRKSRYTDKGDSTGNQIDLALEYIHRIYPEEEYEVEIIIYEDEGFSGGSFDRPRLQDFLADESVNPFDILICYRLDRISRNVSDFSGLMDKLNKYGTNFVSIREQFDTTTPMGRAMMYIASVFAQLEREVIAERIRDNLLELSKTGIWLGGDAPTGFSSTRYEIVKVCEVDDLNVMERKNKKACKLVINEEEIKIPILIYKKYRELKSLSQLETYLIQNNILSKNGSYYTVTTLKQILSNPTYAQNDKDVFEYFTKKGIEVFAENDGRNDFDGNYGFLTYNKTNNRKKAPTEEWIYAVGLHKGVILGKEWVEVQSILEKNKDKCYRAAIYPRKQTIVSGLIRCKHCNSYMRPRNMGKRRKDGTIPYRYSCVLKEKSKGQKCNAENVAGEKLDNRIIDIIKEIFVPNSEIYNELKKMTLTNNNLDDTVEELQYLENAYQKNEEAIEQIMKKMIFIEADLIDIINVELRKLKEKREQLLAKIKEVKQKKNKTNKVEFFDVTTIKNMLMVIDNSFQIFEKFDLKSKKDIANIFIESIVGNGEEVEINLLNTKIDEFAKQLIVPTMLKEGENNYTQDLVAGYDNKTDNNLPPEHVSNSRNWR